MQKKIIFILALIFSFSALFVHDAYALSISPARLEIITDPGQTYKGELSITNDQDTVKTFYSSIQNFESRGETGSPFFLPDATTGLASWIKTELNVDLQPGEKKTIPFTIDVPQGTEGGGYFAAIFWGSAPNDPTNKSQVSIGGKLGMLVLLSISGKTQEAGGLLEFKLNNGTVLSSLPANFEYRFSNDGAQMVKPEGQLKINNILGQEAAIIDINPNRGNVLPKSVRKYTIKKKKKNQNDFLSPEPKDKTNEIINSTFFASAGRQWNNFTIGFYTANLSFAYGQEKKTVESKIHFFIFPWQLLSLLFGALLAFWLFIKFGVKKYNRWIISKANSTMPAITNRTSTPRKNSVRKINK